MSKYFKKLITIELSEYSVNQCKNIAKSQNITNITFFQGESQNLLKLIIENDLKDYKKCIFFLDAHVTGKSRIDTAVGEIDVPVCLELEMISENYKGEAIVIVDDCRCFNTTNSAEADWSNINLDTVKKSLKDRNYEFKFFDSENNIDKNDRLVIHLKKN